MKKVLAIIAALLTGLPASASLLSASVRSADPQVLDPQNEDPLAGVEDLILAGRIAEAQAAARRAQRIFGLRQDRTREGLSLLVLAAAKLVAKDYPGAAADCEASASMLNGPGDGFNRWIALWHLGLLKGALRQLDEAIAQHRSSLALLREIEASPKPFSTVGLKYTGKYLQMPSVFLQLPRTHAEVLKLKLLQVAEGMTRRALLDALLTAGQIEEVDAELARLSTLSDQLDGMFGEEAALYLGSLRRLQWRLDEARNIFHQFLAENRPSLGRELEILRSLIELEIADRRPEEALALTERALGLARRHGAASEEAKLLLFRAHILHDGKHLSDAEKDLRKSLDFAQRSGDLYEQARIHQKLAHVASADGRPEQAIAQLETAARLFHAADRPEEEADIWIQVSSIHVRLNSITNARAALGKVRDLAEKSQSPSLQAKASILEAMERFHGGANAMAEVESRLLAFLALPEARSVQPAGEHSRLIDLVADITQILDRKEGGPALSTSAGGEERGPNVVRGLPRLIRGYAHYQHEQFSEARRLWLAALAEEPSDDSRIFLLAFIGFSHAREGRDEEAIGFLAQAVAVVEQTVENVRLEELLADYLGGEKQVLFGDLIDLLVRNGRVAEAFEYAERARARAFLQGLGNPRLKIPQGAEPELAREIAGVRRRMIELQRKRSSASTDEQQRLSSDLAQLRDRYESLLVRLKVKNRDLQPWAPVKAQKMSAIREQLGRETSLVSYFVSSSGIQAWVLDHEELHHATLQVDPEDLHRAVCWADQLRRRGASHVHSPCGVEPARAEEVYTRLIAPLRGFIRYRRLIVIPHGELHALPFAALRDPQGGRFLVEDFTLVYAPSASALGFLRGKETATGGKARVFKAPEELDPRLGPLEAARREADLVARLFGTRAETREGLLYQRAGEVDLLHIAAHGIYEPRASLFSHIALSADGDHDGNLEVHEILSDVDLTGVNLVVLAACDTARGERSRGDEITSLTRAFLYAGSPGVISTLWSIDDEAAAALMEEFYDRLLAGATAAEALRQAQIALFRHPLYRDPAFWAAFSLTGDPQGKWTKTQRKVKP